MEKVFRYLYVYNFLVILEENGMLKYLIQTTEDLVVLAILIGITLSYVRLEVKNKIVKWIPIAGIGAGVIASIVMAILKNTTRWIDTGMWNLGIFCVSIVMAVSWIVLSILYFKKSQGRIGEWIAGVSSALLMATYIFYRLPDVLAYPYIFSLTEDSLLSTSYLYTLIGYALGIVLMVVVGIALYKTGLRSNRGIRIVLLDAVIVINAIQQVTTALQVMLAKRLIKSNHNLFVIAKFSSNYSDVFIYGTMLLSVVLALVLIIRSFRVNEPYKNPAEHRKILAKWKKNKRWAVVVMVCLLLSVLNLTVVKAIDSKEIELSPVEEAAIDGENIYVPFEQVEDGHLHRFGYTTENGTQIRFIVIQKPNSSSYGIGLDACDICGETGYYEKDGQVVCKLCDVVMNINTIGFKGGCNPIVIDYHIDNGKIVVPIAGLLEHEDEFK